MSTYQNIQKIPLKNANRKTAVFSLLILAVALALALLLDRILWPGNLWLGAFIAGCEAGLVGGLTDWFAVTALFRHPFGLRLPHTAILPRNRVRITDALVSMVENDLLHKDSIQTKIRSFKVANRIMEALRIGLHTDAMKAIISQVIQSILKALPMKTLQAFLRQWLTQQAERVDMSALLRLLTEESLKRKLDEEVLDTLLDKAGETLAEERFGDEIGRLAVHALQHMHLKGFMKVSVPTLAGWMGERKTGKLIQDFLLTFAKDLKTQDNPNREALLSYVKKAMENLPESEEAITRLENLLQELLSEDALNLWIDRHLEDGRTDLLILTKGDSFLNNTLLPFLDVTLVRALADEEMMARLESFLGAQLSQLVDRHHEQIGAVVRENVERFDTDSLTRLIEDKVGDDLQWIRVNGAISGFIVGLFLFGIKTAALLLYP